MIASKISSPVLRSNKAIKANNKTGMKPRQVSFSSGTGINKISSSFVPNELFGKIKYDASLVADEFYKSISYSFGEIFDKRLKAPVNRVKKFITGEDLFKGVKVGTTKIVDLETKQPVNVDVMLNFTSHDKSENYLLRRQDHTVAHMNINDINLSDCSGAGDKTEKYLYISSLDNFDIGTYARAGSELVGIAEGRAIDKCEGKLVVFANNTENPFGFYYRNGLRPVKTVNETNYDSKIQEIEDVLRRENKKEITFEEVKTLLSRYNSKALYMPKESVEEWKQAIRSSESLTCLTQTAR